ncbi:hypothetical protein HK097_003663 [Rhizophlyctis rosea]|uniref:Uncharacterized protein n=1 Tax=Rhizophlyctis rosea TaxID=64517 RepID=A0AAD5WZY0_9FUNG|nr:hypothetical protein HK097_003663 [Rhizophlyctis rosea]
MNPLLRTVTRVAARPQPAIQRRFASTGNNTYLSTNTIRELLPDLKITSETTLGEIYEKAFKNYRSRMIWPVIGWAGLMYYIFNTPYISEAEKKQLRARDDYLKSLEYHDEE